MDKIDVLDHGHVQLLASMPPRGSHGTFGPVEGPIGIGDRTPVRGWWPGDYVIVEAARASYGKGMKTLEEDKKLLKYLWDHKHTSPFEMVEFKFEIQMPLFLARQWMTYRTASTNEISGRYTQLDPVFYRPDKTRLNNAMQCPKNKQNSNGPITEAMQVEFNELLDLGNEIYHKYDNLISQGMSKELARIGLPMNMYTRFVWKNDLHNTLNLLRQRLNPAAQWEIRQYAGAVLDLIRPIVPWTCELFENELESTDATHTD